MDGLLNISYEEFMGIKVNVPCKEEQEQIAQFFRTFDMLITLHQRKLKEE